MEFLSQLPENAAERRLWLLNAIIVVGMIMGAGNLALYPVTREQTIPGNVYGFLWVGTIFGQAGLVAVWLALGQPGPLLRLAVAGAAFLVLAGAFLTGYFYRESLEDTFSFDGIAQLASAVLTLPIFLAAATAPLWLLRVYLGWHIRDGNSPPAATNFRQYSIRSLIMLTTLVAVLLGAGLQANRLAGGDPLGYWFSIFGLSLAILIVSAATLIPAALLLSRYPLVGFCVLTGVATGIFVLTVLFVLSIIRSFGGSLASAEIWGTIGLFACPLLGFLVTLCLPLCALRRYGYRLVTGARKSKSDGSTQVLST